MADGKLTALGIRKQTKPGTYNDGSGLYLRVGEAGKSWLYRFKLNGKANWMGIGSLNDYSLAEARDKARECRKLLDQGINPLEARKAAKAAALEAEGQTFKLMAERYIKAHEAEWRSAKHTAQWTATLTAYAYPLLKDKPVHSIGVNDVLEVLEPIWTAKPETASRVRGRIEAVLDYAAARKLRSTENPARWRGNLDHLLPRRSKVAKVEHHAAIPYADLPALMAKLAESKGVSAMCLRFTILTAARSGEARGAKWAEIDMAAATWTVPAERMKAAREHRVPLSDQAVAILNEMAQLGAEPDKLVFPGQVKKKPLSDVAVSKALTTAGGEAFTVHGMRSAFRQWCAEQTAYPAEVAETALAHVNKDKVEAAYQRSDLFEKRRRLMAEWARFCAEVRKPVGNVAVLRGA